MQNNKTATNGEISFYKQICGKKVTALIVHSNKGKGWRPVCGGKYLGDETFGLEAEAIKAGKKFIADLTQRVINAESAKSALQISEENKSPSPEFTGYLTHVDGNPLIDVKEQEIQPLIFPASKKSKRSRKKDLVKND